jgi:hypothetical protein
MKWAVAAMAICITCPAFAQLAPSPHAVKFEDIKWEPLEWSIWSVWSRKLFRRSLTKTLCRMIRPA